MGLPDYCEAIATRYDNQDSNHNDIDVIGFHPMLEGDRKVVAVSCKSWQDGFNPASEIDAIENDKIVRGPHAPNVPGGGHSNRAKLNSTYRCRPDARQQRK